MPRIKVKGRQHEVGRSWLTTHKKQISHFEVVDPNYRLGKKPGNALLIAHLKGKGGDWFMESWDDMEALVKYLDRPAFRKIQVEWFTIQLPEPLTKHRKSKARTTGASFIRLAVHDSPWIAYGIG